METQPVRAYSAGTVKTKEEFWEKFLRTYELITDISLTPMERKIMAYAMTMTVNEPFKGQPFKLVAKHFGISIHTLAMHKRAMKNKGFLTEKFGIIDSIKRAIKQVESSQRYALEIPIRFNYVKDTSTDVKTD